MSESYILHDAMRKVKADGLFDSIRRDLISDIEQKPSYLDLKSQIESLMSSYLSQHKWSTSLKKTDIRERARRHIETSNLIKDTLPTLVNQYMQTCQQQLVQSRLSSFVSEHIQHVYNSIGGTHIYHPSTSYTQSNSIPQEKISQSTLSTKQESIVSKSKNSINKNPQISNNNQKKISMKMKPQLTQTNSMIENKKIRILSPVHSPNDLVDISPSTSSIDNERTTISLSPSPPPPIVRIASPLTSSSNTELSQELKRLQDNNTITDNDESSEINIKKKKIKTDDFEDNSLSDEKFKSIMEDVNSQSISNETDTRKLRTRRPNPKYATEQFETDNLNMIESSSTNLNIKKLCPLKLSTNLEQEHFDISTSSCPIPASIQTSQSIGNMSPEYETSLFSPSTEQQSIEKIDESLRTPSPMAVDIKTSTSPRRLRPRKANERISAVDNEKDKIFDSSTRTSVKTRESIRPRIEQTTTLSVNDNIDLQPSITKKIRAPSSSSTIENNSKELPNRSISVPNNLNATTDETQTSRLSSSTMTPPVSKSFIWKPRILK